MLFVEWTALSVLLIKDLPGTSPHDPPPRPCGKRLPSCMTPLLLTTWWCVSLKKVSTAGRGAFQGYVLHSCVQIVNGIWQAVSAMHSIELTYTSQPCEL